MDGPTSSTGAVGLANDAVGTRWVQWLGVVAAAVAATAFATVAWAPLPEVPSLESMAAAVVPPPAVPSGASGSPAALPELLSETGLYAASQALHPDVIEFSPQYPLWSDGASKRRYLRLPEGSSIDASNPDAWVFPVGTRFWKEFSLGHRVETRYIERRADGSWVFASYLWDDQGQQARLVPEAGRLRAAPLRQDGLHHDIPSRGDCVACHEGAGERAPILGFTALQLSTDRDPLAPHAETPSAAAFDLNDLIAHGLVRGYPAAASPPRVEASTPTARAALGYLHANCSGCHNAYGPLSDLNLDFEQRIGEAGDSERVLGTLISQAGRFRLPEQEHSQRVVPGDAQASVVHFRLTSRQLAQQMPPLGSKVVDREAAELVATWIAQLNPNAPPGAPQETP